MQRLRGHVSVVVPGGRLRVIPFNTAFRFQFEGGLGASAEGIPVLREFLREGRKYLDVLLAVAIRFQTDRRHRWLLGVGGVWVEQGEFIRGLPGLASADGLPWENAIGTLAPRIPTPCDCHRVVRADGVVATIENQNLLIQEFPIEDLVPILSKGSLADDAVSLNPIERIALPLRPRDIASIQDVRLGIQLRDTRAFDPV